ncbi:BolA family transcriptional regulator [bacterium]|nr:BolA family transcriptional regulator [bacterium]
MKRRSKIEQIIKEGFAPHYFSVLDVSEEHRGHQSFQENIESHFEIVIVSKIFNNKSKIDRHRMVNQTLKKVTTTITLLKMKVMMTKKLG